nr:ras-related protein Rab-26-like [Danio rerio]|eukprot:XP_021330479.1 ras-related protein Rab-26-like [Danio rerio]
MVKFIRLCVSAAHETAGEQLMERMTVEDLQRIFSSGLEMQEQTEAADPDSAYGSSPGDTDTEDGGHALTSSSSTTLVYNQELMHKTILVGDSGVGKTSLLVQFDQGKFISGSFSATVGIGFTVSFSTKSHKRF